MSDEDFIAPDEGGDTEVDEVPEEKKSKKRKAPEDKKEKKKKRKSAPRGQNWAWTWNTRWDDDNDKEEVLMLSAYLQQRSMHLRDQEDIGRGQGRYLRYIVWQVERAMDGRWHLQGFMEFAKSVRMKWVKDTLGDSTVHCELAANPEDARNYCMKECQVMNIKKWKKKNKGHPVLWWGHLLEEGEVYAKREPKTIPVEVGHWCEDRDNKGYVKPLGRFKDAIIEEGNKPSSDINLIHRYPDAMAKYDDSVFDNEFAPVRDAFEEPVPEYMEGNWEICEGCMNPNMFCYCLAMSDYNSLNARSDYTDWKRD